MRFEKEGEDNGLIKKEIGWMQIGKNKIFAVMFGSNKPSDCWVTFYYFVTGLRYSN